MLLWLLVLISAPCAEGDSNSAYLVETLPRQMDGIGPIDGVLKTGETLTKLVQGVQKTLDLTAMYWVLTTTVTPPCQPGQRNCPDEAGFSRDQLNTFGAQVGSGLYDAIVDAAKRGVHIRIIQAPGFGPDGNPESAALDKNFTNVEVRTVQMEDWYNGGIMHQKLWVFDGESGYVGSANQDWKSLAQVKELGIAFYESPEVVTTLQQHFDVWWQFVSLNGSDYATMAHDYQYDVNRTVPCWSRLSDSCANPLVMPSTPQGNIESPHRVTLNDQPGNYYLSCSPPETCVANRSADEDSLVYTIKSAEKTVSISVMDWIPASLYSDIPIFWDVLINAVTSVINAKGISVRLLVSKWAHTNALLPPYLAAFQSLANACKASKYKRCKGSLEIKYFEIPGWNSTIGPDRQFPGHTRVNHAKYIVSDQRANIGTSNMVWGYFHNTAGSSFNTNIEGIVSTLQQIFDRDWASPYAHPLE